MPKKPPNTPEMTDKARLVRLQWCEDHKDWTEADWKKVLFTDESGVKETAHKRIWFFRTKS
jgi:hypothetical protein